MSAFACGTCGESACGCANGELAALIDGLLQDQLTAWPVLGSSVGIEARDDELGDFSAEACGRREEDEESWLRRFEAISPARLDGEEQIDRELVLAALRGSAVMREWGTWRRNPDVYLQPAVQGVLTLFLHRREPEGRLADAAGARLEAVAGVLEHARANLDPALVSPVLAARAAAQCRSTARYLSELLPLELREDRLRARVASAAAGASRAYARFAGFLEQLRAQAGGSFAIGRERYDRLLRERELLHRDAVGLREQGELAYEELTHGLQREAERLGQSGGWRALLSDLRSDCPDSEEEMQELYTYWTERARKFVSERRLVSLPRDERCQVQPAPAFYRPMLAVPFHSWLPPFGSSHVGRLFVPFAPADAAAEERRDRLRFNSRAAIPSICVHESYPGHHWHALMIQAHARPARRLFMSQFFLEGWAVYSESMMGEQGFYTDPHHELARVGGRMFRALRAVVDTSLHLEEIGVEEATAMLVEKGSVPPATARAEVIRCCSWPTQGAAYLAGAIEIERLRACYLDHGAENGLLAFHQAICESGALPLALATRALEQAPSAQTSRS